MIKSISKLVGIMASSGIVEESDKELYEYGLYVGMVLIFNVISALFIAFAMNMLLECVVLMTAYIPLRNYAGGYHADNQIKCYVYSMLVIAIQLYLLKIDWPVSVTFTIMFISGLIISLLTPIESENKLLNEKEKQKYAKKTRIITGIEMWVAFLLINTGFHQYAESIMISIATVTILMLKGR